MSRKKRVSKKERQEKLKEMIKEDPFQNDEELASNFGVSIQTLRLDRMELGIPELRERFRNVAQANYEKVRSMTGTEIVGELIDLTLGKQGLSILETDEEMAFTKTNIVRGHHIFSQAESLAMAVIDADVALTGVANIKYLKPIYLGDKLVAKAELVRIRGNKHFVHVKITVNQKQVFRGKFIFVSLSMDMDEE
ncbi:transcription factor FapR [Isachenkonia alkalipeptolytica]|uniref:Transcription factor FapR n=1 Tax=Isachenkonia alkalipeptolytica TaxID=2565777 RepID=A0AA44BG54_9CLOT|nr:transcription factor FapR [Isachenkonia alkalipeptolytica]NBG89111.1 transcription factor FapR [Isachenkonia alkalipeptolytica]